MLSFYKYGIITALYIAVIGVLLIGCQFGYTPFEIIAYLLDCDTAIVVNIRIFKIAGLNQSLSEYAVTEF